MTDFDRLRNARLLVTGGHGFLGRRLRARLAMLGVKQIQAPSSGELDLLDRAAIRAHLARERPSFVVHLAARVGGIGKNQRQPADLFHDNAVMGIQLIDECRRARAVDTAVAEKIVVVGTVCAYPKHAAVPFTEDAIWDGYPEETNAAYGLAKKMLLVQAQAYRAQYGLNTIVVFPANLYGPDDNFDLETSHVVPAMIRKIDVARRRGDREVELWGDGSPTRELLYVDDCAEALCLAAERYDASDPVNIGTGSDISIGELARKIAGMLEYDGRLAWNEARPNGQPRRRLDVTRARERFGFTSSTSLDEGLLRTIEWWQREGRARWEHVT